MPRELVGEEVQALHLFTVHEGIWQQHFAGIRWNVAFVEGPCRQRSFEDQPALEELHSLMGLEKWERVK